MREHVLGDRVSFLKYDVSLENERPEEGVGTPATVKYVTCCGPQQKKWNSPGHRFLTQCKTELPLGLEVPHSWRGAHRGGQPMVVTSGGNWVR